MGTYTTIDIKKLKILTEEEIEEAANILSEELKELVNTHVDSMADVLVVGLVLPLTQNILNLTMKENQQ